KCITGNQRETAPGLTFFSQNLPRPVWSAAVIWGRLQMLVSLFVFESDDISFDMPAIVDKQT
ncbi:unnamed protein product, partial [marine sediment metagenome]